MKHDPKVPPIVTQTDDAERHRIPGALPPEATPEITTASSHRHSTEADFANIPHIPGYQITGILGRGGMGVVYSGIQLGLGREVAIKTVLNTETAGSMALVRFLNEAEVVASIHDPVIVTVFELGEENGLPYLVMEYLPGGNLADRLKTSGPLEPQAAAQLLARAARGVAAAHGHGIVHRDLKPANILFTAAGEAKITDFGIAKRPTSELTATQAQLGTPSYMAPEQASGRAKFVGPAADVWALGVILYECLTGCRPFVGDSVVDVIREVCQSEPNPVDRVAPRTPRDLAHICMKCLRKSPGDRYPDAGALADDLDRYLRGESIHARRDWFWYRARRMTTRYWKPAAAALVLAGVFLAVWLAPPPTWWQGVAALEDASEARRQEIALRVSGFLRKPPTPDLKPVHPITVKSDLPQPDISPFKILYDDRVIDLRGWDPDAPIEEGDRTNFVVSHLRQNIFKDQPVDEYVIELWKRGEEMHQRVVLPNNNRVAIRMTDDSTNAVGSLPGKFHVVLNVENVPDDGTFETYVVVTTLGRGGHPDEHWVAMGRNCLTSSVLILFPKNRPFKSFRITRTPSPRVAATLYEGPRSTITDPDHQWLYCEVSDPQSSQMYRVEWEW